MGKIRKIYRPGQIVTIKNTNKESKVFRLDIENIQMPKMVDYVRIDAYNRREERRHQRETFRYMNKFHRKK